MLMLPKKTKDPKAHLVQVAKGLLWRTVRLEDYLDDGEQWWYVVAVTNCRIMDTVDIIKRSFKYKRSKNKYVFFCWLLNVNAEEDTRWNLWATSKEECDFIDFRVSPCPFSPEWLLTSKCNELQKLGMLVEKHGPDLHRIKRRIDTSSFTKK